MKGLSFQQQDRCVIESEICHHSRAILQLGENFRSRYKNELPSDINSFDGTNNACLFYPHRKTAIMRSDPDPSGMCLVGYQNNGKVSLLYTTSSKNKIPLCSQCRGDDCLCYKAFREGCKKGLFSRTILQRPRRPLLPHPLRSHFKYWDGCHRSLIHEHILFASVEIEKL